MRCGVPSFLFLCLCVGRASLGHHRRAARRPSHTSRRRSLAESALSCVAAAARSRESARGSARSRGREGGARGGSVALLEVERLGDVVQRVELLLDRVLVDAHDAHARWRGLVARARRQQRRRRPRSGAKAGRKRDGRPAVTNSTPRTDTVVVLVVVVRSDPSVGLRARGRGNGRRRALGECVAVVVVIDSTLRGLLARTGGEGGDGVRVLPWRGRARRTRTPSRT